MAKKGENGYIYSKSGCDYCGQTQLPLNYYKPTNEWLDDDCLAQRKRERVAKEYTKRLIKENRYWQDRLKKQGG